jgi:hypothetical protein
MKAYHAEKHPAGLKLACIPGAYSPKLKSFGLILLARTAQFAKIIAEMKWCGNFR